MKYSKFLYISLNAAVLLAIIIYFTLNMISKFHDESDNIYKNLEDYVAPILNSAEEISKNDIFLLWIKNGEDETELDSIREKSIKDTGVTSIDIASSITGITYQTGGTKVTLSRENERDYWYYNFIEGKKDTGIELYYDSTSGSLFLYYNVKIYDSNKVVGVIGFLIDYKNIVDVLKEHSGNMEAYLIDNFGNIYLHEDQTKIGDIDIYDYYGLLQKSNSDINHVNIKENSILKTAYHFKYLDSYLIVEQKLNFTTLSLSPEFYILLLYILLNVIYLLKVKRSKP